MNREEYAKWRSDALVMLNLRYSPNESRVIIEWMDRIKGAAERDLMGEIRTHLDAILDLDINWDLYNSLTYRMWLYAPYILIDDAEYLEEYNECLMA